MISTEAIDIINIITSIVQVIIFSVQTLILLQQGEHSKRLNSLEKTISRRSSVDYKRPSVIITNFTEDDKINTKITSQTAFPTQKFKCERINKRWEKLVDKRSRSLP